MKVFLGYGYNERDRWVEELIFPLVKAFGAEPISGKEVYGQKLGDAIESLIEKSQAVIGFTTQRYADDQYAKWGTHRWVTDELTTASNFKIPFVEVRETGIDPQDGILAGRAHISYDPAKREQCLIEIARALGEWVRAAELFELHFLPAECTQALLPLMGDKNLTCTYKMLLRDENEPLDRGSTTLIPIGGNIAIRIRNVPKGAFIAVEVTCQQKLFWRSTFQPVEARSLHLSNQLPA